MSRNLDLLLVNVGGTRKKVYQNLDKTPFSGIETPSWVALTAGFIRKNGYNVDIIDSNALNLDHEETTELVKQKDPKLTGILVYGQQANTSTPTMIGVSALAKEIKKQEPNRPLVITGWHPSALPERTLNEESCDFVGEGEGFYTYLGLLKNESLEKVPGLWWKKDGKTIHNPRSKNIADLTSELKDIAWDLLPMDKYRAYYWHGLTDLKTRTKYASLYTSFGCPFKCNFCCIHSNFDEYKIRNWNPEWVLDQIGHLVEEYGIKHLKINDEMFILDPNHFMPIAEGLIKRDYGLNLTAFARVDSAKKKYLSTLKKAGFNWFQLGIESGNREVLDQALKGKYDLKKIKESVKDIQDAGINLCANFIFGLPGDTLETMQETLNLATELNCVFPSFFGAMAPPGSELYKIAKERGHALPGEKGNPGWIGYAQQGYEFLPLPTETLSAKEVLRFRDYAFDTYYKNPRYLKSIEQKFGVDVKKDIEDMAKIKLKRKILGD